MKSFATASIALLFMSVSAPSLACDMHGGGYYNQMGFSDWAPYTPYEPKTDTSVDSAAIEQLDEAQKEAKYANDAAPKTAKKPSFSAVSLRASGAAKARLLKAKAEPTADVPSDAAEKSKL